jgi:cleavage and polyadenylation specificity factor subunit 1
MPHILILDLPAQPDLCNTIDFVFFTWLQQSDSRHPSTNPTNLDRVCTSYLYVFSMLTVFRRLKEFNDTVKLIIFALDIATQIYPTSNALIYADQPSRRVALPLNRWRGRFSDLP